MSHQEPDGIDELLAGGLRLAVTAAVQLGEVAARRREQEARQQQAAADQEARQIRARLEAERSAGLAQLQPTLDRGWWDRAEPRDVADVVQTAGALREDPAAAPYRDRIAREVRDRYDLDVDDLRDRGPAIDAALARSTRLQQTADYERVTGRGERAQADLMVADAIANPDHRTDTRDVDDVAQDLHARADGRDAVAGDLEDRADAETVTAKTLADTNQAQPAQAATRTQTRRPRARPTSRPATRAPDRSRGL